MSVLIKGMEMPETCDKCSFQSALRLYCDAMPYNFCGNTDDIERPDWCPLIELPPHGRLIDADELSKQKYENIWTNRLVINADDLDDAPTVIEAEEKND